jgi:hypothetical protein
MCGRYSMGWENWQGPYLWQLQHGVNTVAGCESSQHPAMHAGNTLTHSQHATLRHWCALTTNYCRPLRFGGHLLVGCAGYDCGASVGYDCWSVIPRCVGHNRVPGCWQPLDSAFLRPAANQACPKRARVTPMQYIAAVLYMCPLAAPTGQPSCSPLTTPSWDTVVGLGSQPRGPS